MHVTKKYDDINCWYTITFNIENQEVGTMNLEITGKHAYIHSICSYKQKQGIGTMMIEFLRTIDIAIIEGTADPDSIGFWENFPIIWNDDDFKMYLL